MNGVIILDKPEGFTSFDAVAVMRGLSGERRIGHTGTLDPMATGVLPLLLGRAAKAADLLPDTRKEYLASFRLGEQRDTGDRTGKLLSEDSVFPAREELEQAMKGFSGEMMQIPPMYSAVSVGGKRLYELARKGVEIERAPRPVTIYALSLLSYQEATREGAMAVSCSKGTYIRTLIEDIAEKAGTRGVMTALRRTFACGFSQQEAVPLEELRALKEKNELHKVLRPVDSLFSEAASVTVSGPQGVRFRNGGALDLKRLRFARAPAQGERMRVYDGDKRFLGLGEVIGEELKVKKLFWEGED